MTGTRLSRDPEVFRKTMREFAEETLKPLADREASFHTEAFEEMAGMGILGAIGEGTSEIQRLVIARTYDLHENMGKE